VDLGWSSININTKHPAQERYRWIRRASNPSISFLNELIFIKNVVLDRKAGSIVFSHPIQVTRCDDNVPVYIQEKSEAKACSAVCMEM
jgi:hypothetical protein